MTKNEWDAEMKLIRQAEAFEAEYRRKEIFAETVAEEDAAKRLADGWAKIAADIRHKLCLSFA